MEAPLCSHLSGSSSVDPVKYLACVPPLLARSKVDRCREGLVRDHRPEDRAVGRKARERCDVSRREQALGGGGTGDQACGTLDDVLLHAVCQWKRRHRFSPISGNWHATRLRISFFILTGISRTPPFLLQVDDQIQPLELKSPQRSTRFFDHQANT